MNTLPCKLADVATLTASSWLFAAGITIIILAITTRIRSSSTSVHVNANDGAVSEIPKVPYWLPVIGHIPQMVVDSTYFLRRLRDTYTHGAYSLNLGGTTHTIVYSPSLVTALLDVEDAHASHDSIADSVAERVFGFPVKAEGVAYRQSVGHIRSTLQHLTSEDGLQAMVNKTSRIVDRTMCNLVTFSASLVDQTNWERTAQCEVTTDQKGTQVVAANLLDLIKDYCAAASTESMLGSDFAQNNPNYLADLWLLDRAFVYLAAGLPRWTPIPLVTRAHIARRNLIRSFVEFEVAMDKRADGVDPGAQWNELEDMGAVVRARLVHYRNHGLSMEARATCELDLIWAINAKSNMLVFWMIVRIYADPELLTAVRSEIQPYVRATQVKGALAIAEPPRLSTLRVEGLCTLCPLLKSCYIECLRIDSSTWSSKVAKEDFVLRGRDKKSKAYLIRKGDFVHAAHDLHNSDPAYFPEPESWKADRHIREDEQGKRTADPGTLRSYGGGSNVCKGRFLAYKECMIFAAAMIAMWDIEPVNGKAWKVPEHRGATGVYGSNNATRVHLKRRALPEE